MRITGELLKSERLSQGLSVQHVAASLKLSVKIINAIEAGDGSQLPAKTFVRGFVRSYAEFLKLNPDVVLRQFQEEMGTTSPLPKVPPPPPSSPGESIKGSKPSLRQTSQNYTHTKSVTSASIKQQNMEEQNLNNKIIMFLFGAVVLVVLIIAGTRLFQSDPAPPVVESDSANVIIPSYDSTEPSASATAEVPPLAPATDTSATVTATFTDVVSGTSAASSTVAQQPVTQDEILPQSPGKPIELILEPKKDTEIQYAKGNTSNFKSLKLVANKVQILRSSTGLHLKASDGAAFKITVNGLDKGNAGAANKPVKLTF
jgi:cytoskeleton protein RodZ